MEGLFQKNIVITGKHATYIKALVAKPDTNLRHGIFERQVDVFVASAIVGKIYSHKVEADTTKGEDGEEQKATMYLEQINTIQPELELNYRMLMLLEEKDSLAVEERMNRAFRYDRNEEKRKECEKIFMSYALGGIEVLYDKLIAPSKSLDDYVDNLYLFVKDFKERYYREELNKEIFELCKLATS